MQTGEKTAIIIIKYKNSEDAYMEYNKLIAGMHTGDDVEGFYVLKDAFLKTTAAGKPFLSGVLADLRRPASCRIFTEPQRT